MAILNFVFGGLGLFCALCQGGSLALMGNMDSLFGKAGTPNPMADMINQVPGFLPFSIFQHACNLVLSICLIVAGFGLLKMSGWGRWLSVGYAVTNIVAHIGMLVYQLVYLNPALAKWQQDFVAKQAGGRAQPTPFVGDSTLSNIGSVVGALIGMAYAIALLVVMFLPHVSAAFAGKAPLHEEEPEDYFDEGFRNPEEAPQPPDEHIRQPPDRDE
jgi:hypothetical protein